jgi:hypothetical protein
MINLGNWRICVYWVGGGGGGGGREIETADHKENIFWKRTPLFLLSSYLAPPFPTCQFSKSACISCIERRKTQREEGLEFKKSIAKSMGLFLLSSHWPGIIKLIPARESFVSMKSRLGTGKSLTFFTV